MLKKVAVKKYVLAHLVKEEHKKLYKSRRGCLV